MYDHVSIYVYIYLFIYLDLYMYDHVSIYIYLFILKIDKGKTILPRNLTTLVTKYLKTSHFEIVWWLFHVIC
jgi:hypothetical protein